MIIKRSHSKYYTSELNKKNKVQKKNRTSHFQTNAKGIFYNLIKPTVKPTIYPESDFHKSFA